MDEKEAPNVALWNRWAELHKDSGFYDIDAFRRGRSTLKEIERAELDAVAGRSLLHLQCHFGLDTLSWAREGARVTGLDFSPRAIDIARELALELAIPARFVCAPVEDPAPLEGARFDIVFTSYGVLEWLADLDAWARTVARHLAPGGRFYMVEFHPLTEMLDDRGEEIAHGYFSSGAPQRFEHRESYAGAAHEPLGSELWAHGLGEIVTALLAAGLRPRFLHEFPWSPYDCFPGMIESAPGRHVFERYPGLLPLTYSILADAPA